MKHTDGTKCAGERCAWAGMRDHVSLPDDAPPTIAMNEPTQAFYKGVAAGSDVLDTLPEGEFLQRLSFYWLAVGTAANDKGITDETLDKYVLGASTRAPSPDFEELESALEACDRAAEGDSNDREIEALQNALDVARGLIGHRR